MCWSEKKITGSPDLLPGFGKGSISSLSKFASSLKLVNAVKNGNRFIGLISLVQVCDMDYFNKF